MALTFGASAPPFFIHWDVLCGTRMTREEIEAKKAARVARAKQIAEARLSGKTEGSADGDVKAIADDSDSGVDIDKEDKPKKVAHGVRSTTSTQPMLSITRIASFIFSFLFSPYSKRITKQDEQCSSI